MKSILQIFGRGLVALLPTFLSIYIIISFFSWIDLAVQRFISLFMPWIQGFPGMGFLIGLIFIFLLGLLLSNYLGAKLHQWVDGVFRKVPLVKSIYSAIQDLTDYFSPKGASESQVVVYSFPESNIQAIGLVTRKDLKDLPQGLDKEGKVAVYFPMSYMMGGVTLFLPKDQLKPLDIPVEVAMRSALTGWMKR